MCSFGGLAQGWWSVAGLCSDIFGFSLLALDVGREYLRHKRAEQLLDAAHAAEWLVRDDERKAELDEWEKSDPELMVPRKEMRELRRNIQHAGLRIAELTLAHREGKGLGGKPGEKAAAFRELAREAGLKPFKRGPIFIGVFFVLMGFVLQVAGSIPCS
jgi:hypothetical protein